VASTHVRGLPVPPDPAGQTVVTNAPLMAVSRAITIVLSLFASPVNGALTVTLLHAVARAEGVPTVTAFDAAAVGVARARTPSA
jgi:hypothetical protein